jgi:hypothetical protein
VSGATGQRRHSAPCRHCGSVEKAASGRCLPCKRAYDRDYNKTSRGRERTLRYEATAAAIRRKVRYDLERFDRDYEPYLQLDRLQEREEYEASGSDLPFYEWLEKCRPLPKLGRLVTEGSA